MAIAEMSKLNLVAMSYDKDDVLNALQKTNASEIKLHKAEENTLPATEDFDELLSYLSETEAALEYLSAEIETYNKENKIKSDSLSDGFSVSFTEFMAAKDFKEQADSLTAKINDMQRQRKELYSELTKLRRTKSSAEIYSTVEEPLNGFGDTRNARVKLGTVPLPAVEGLLAATAEAELCECRQLSATADEALIFFVSHKSAVQAADGILQQAGFVPSPFAQEERSGAQIFSSIAARESDLEKGITANVEELVALGAFLKPLKIYCDYLRFELEKKQLSEKMRKTLSTVLIEAYVPKEAEEGVAAALDGVSNAVYYEFSAPAEDEIPPTLYKNNAVVKNFESITNMYSPASSREFDPNAVMAFFYSLFLGFIMGDVGYGLLMLFGGGFLYLKSSSDSAIKRLAGVFAIGGIFAIVWGLLFNSFFGISLSFMPTVMPDAQSDRWSFMGIKVPAVLAISLMIGVVQLMAGYICRAVQCMRRGKFWDGMFDGAVWALFSIGVGFAIVGLIEEANAPALATAGGILAGASLLIAVCTAGRKEKFLGKFTKGFGAAYGVINYVSDILSYARLYGLMLSGAVIAKIISGYAVTGYNGSVGFLQSGNVGLIILGIVLLLIGHIFNLAIGLLGAYIHDARLQYVEFYGRFFEGEGELFAPLGSKHKYIGQLNS